MVLVPVLHTALLACEVRPISLVDIHLTIQSIVCKWCPAYELDPVFRWTKKACAAPVRSWAAQ